MVTAAINGDGMVSDLVGQEVTMVDVGDKERPPGDPPDTPVTWAMCVAGSNGGGVPVPEDVLEDSFVVESMRLDFPDGEDGEPVITIGEAVLAAMSGLWKNCLIVKVLGRNVSVAVLSKRLKEMWNPVRAMHVMDLPRQFFMVRFEGEDEYMAALTGGPWRVFGSYLMMRAWSPDFDPLRNEINTTPVWVRIANLPVTLYHKMILMGIAKGLGKPVKVDMTTLKFDRALNERVCVEVDLTKPLKGTILVNGVRYYVSYEGLMKICSSCGMYGHLVHSCPKRAVATSIGGQGCAAVGTSPGSTRTEIPVDVDRTEAGYTAVRSGGRREVVFTAGGSGEVSNTNQRTPASLDTAVTLPTENRFRSLTVNEEMDEVQEVSEMLAENKENECPMNNVLTEKSAAKGKGALFGEDVTPKRGDSRGRKHEKGSRGNKNMESGVHRLKQGKMQTRSMRGLIFGAKLGETELTPTGKRLRVEQSQSAPREVMIGSGAVGKGVQANQSQENLTMGGDQLVEKAGSTVCCSTETRVVNVEGEQVRRCSGEGRQ